MLHRGCGGTRWVLGADTGDDMQHSPWHWLWPFDDPDRVDAGADMAVILEAGGPRIKEQYCRYLLWMPSSYESIAFNDTSHAAPWSKLRGESRAMPHAGVDERPDWKRSDQTRP